MQVYWLEQTEADVPSDDGWLGPSETVRLNGIRFAKRRADWRLGRWTAKRAVAVYLNVPALAGIEIRPAPSGAPEVFCAGAPAAVAVSLSHRAGTAVCAVAPSGVALGCDLETIEPRSDAFIADYFTPEEQLSVARVPVEDRSRLATLLWSGKESTLKALRVGLRIDTRWVSVSVGDAPFCGTWSPMHVGHADGQVFHGWWREQNDFLRTVVSMPSPGPPILLVSTASPDTIQRSDFTFGTG